jgi:hypothetical protein
MPAKDEKILARVRRRSNGGKANREIRFIELSCEIRATLLRQLRRLAREKSET